MNRELLAFAAASFASGFSMRVADPLVLPLARDLGVSVEQAALLSAAYALPYAVAQLLLGPLGDRYGKTRCMQLCGTGMAVALLLSLLATSYEFLFATRVVAGALAGGLIPLVLASLGERYAMHERQIVIGRMLLAIIGGQMLGAAVAGAMAPWSGWRGPFALSAVLAIAGTLALWRFARREATVPAGTAAATGAPRLSYGAMYALVLRNPRAPWLYASVLAEGLLFFSLFPYFGALLLERASQPDAAISAHAGMVLGAFGVGGLVYALSVRRLLALLSVRGMCLTASLAAAGAYAALSFASDWRVCAALMLLAGLCFYMLHNSLQTAATELAPAARASAVSLFACGLFGGQALGTLALAPLLRHVGFTAVLIAIAVAILVLGQIVVRRALPSGADPSARGAAAAKP